MNILFLTKSFGIGGVEVVTMTLAKTFAKHGHQVGIFSFYRADDILEKQLPKDIPLYIAHGYKNSRENISMLRQLLVDKKIEVVINQWGLPFLPIRVINQARKGLKVKVISVYHNQVDTNGKLKACDQAIERCQNPLLRSVLEVKRFLVKSITSYSMRYVYKHSDVYEVLSPSFIELFKKFTGIKNPTKLVAQTNPITIDGSVQSEKITNVDKKEKEIIYVGRLDFVQKRVYRVIDTWSYLEERFPDWRLTIVGDGEDRENLENHVSCLGLKHVSFEGFQNPLNYYKRASMLLLTSDFEGFGLVIIEGMSFGVVPFVYGSYPAVYDIIDDNINGFILPMTEKGYDAAQMAGKMADVMKCPERWLQLSKNAISKSNLFSLENVYSQWKDNLDKMNVGGAILEKNALSYTFKIKEIIYVGRLDFVQKRVYRVIDTWNYLEERFPDWRLTIVGDGEDRENLENHVRCFGLKRVSFEGFQKPIDYYKRASILLLTSDFEGFPLVLAECMSFGVIPAVYNSYSAIGDIIESDKDGVVIPYHKNGYQAEEAAGMVAQIMGNEVKREQMALAAVEKSKDYSVERIYEEWMKILGIK